MGIQEDMRTFDSLLSMIDLLKRFAIDTMESQGHGLGASTALLLSVQSVGGLEENVEALRDFFLQETFGGILVPTGDDDEDDMEC